MIYIYLVRRNKSDSRIIGTIESPHQLPASRLNEFGHLGLSAFDKAELKTTLSNYVLDWEIWIESAETNQELREKLVQRGIKVPSSNTIFHFKAEIPRATILKLNKNKIMTRRMS